MRGERGRATVRTSGHLRPCFLLLGCMTERARKQMNIRDNECVCVCACACVFAKLRLACGRIRSQQRLERKQ